MKWSAAEADYCRRIAEKDAQLRELLARVQLQQPPDARSWYLYLSAIKAIEGNLNNSLSFVATLLARDYLMERFDVVWFDAGAKAQGAAGFDIDACTSAGERVVGEIKTTSPYHGSAFGAAQKREVEKDILKLTHAQAAQRVLFVTDPATFTILGGPRYARRVQRLLIVDVIARNEHHG
jgi:hypothetical protein